MTELKINREFAVRHLAVALLFLGLSGWFAYDGYVNYPRQDETFFEARHLRRENAIARQKEFSVLALIAALVVAGHVWVLSRFRFSFDDKGFVCGGRRFAWSDVKDVNRSQWEKKGIIRVNGIKLDSWHHAGVKEFVSTLNSLTS